MTVYLAYLSVLILFCVAIFQLLLILGFPYGKYAWGGQYKILPQKLRVSSGVTILIYILISLILLSKTRVFSVFNQGQGLDIATKVVAIQFTLGVFLNAISKSQKEKYLMTPIVLILAICSWLIAF
jgi:hypothetical protein